MLLGGGVGRYAQSGEVGVATAVGLRVQARHVAVAAGGAHSSGSSTATGCCVGSGSGWLRGLYSDAGHHRSAVSTPQPPAHRKTETFST